MAQVTKTHSFSLAFGSEINRYPRRTTGLKFSGKSTLFPKASQLHAQQVNCALPPPTTTLTYTPSNKYNNNSSTAKITTPTACCGSVQHYTMPPLQTHLPTHTFSPFPMLHPLRRTWKRSNSSETCSQTAKNILGIGARSPLPMTQEAVPKRTPHCCLCTTRCQSTLANPFRPARSLMQASLPPRLRRR